MVSIRHSLKLRAEMPSFFLILKTTAMLIKKGLIAMAIIRTDARKALYKGDTKTSATALPMICCEGLNNTGKFYIYNGTTGAIYYQFRGCGINTGTTSYWGTALTTATVATGTVTASTFAIISNYMTMEFTNTATGAGSATILQIATW